MAAIRIIDDHLELANIGTNSHAQIDTHIAAADNYVKRDGSLALSSDWDIGDTRKILADEIRARDGAGLKLYDDAGNGIFIKDGGNVGIGTTNPTKLLHVYDNVNGFSTTLTGNNLDFSRAGINYLRATHASGQFNIGAGGNGNDFAILSNHNSIFQNGNVGISTPTPTAKLDINSDIFRVRTAKTPASAGAAGNTGDRAWDADYFYICVATNTWERTAHNTW